MATFLAREGTSQGTVEPESVETVPRSPVSTKRGGQAKRSRAAAPALPALPEAVIVKAKLQMGLNFLLILAAKIHHEALNSSPLQQEFGCEGLTCPHDLHNISLLVSAVKGLEEYPGAEAKGLGKRGMRFPAAQRARLPPDGAAPRARTVIMRLSFLFDDDDRKASTDDQHWTGGSTACCAGRASASARA